MHNDELIIYHWCTFKHNWPTISLYSNLYTPDPQKQDPYFLKVTHNAFASWEYKENSLQLVKSHVSVKTWDLINDLLEKERCRHVAVYAKGFNIINLLEEELEEIRSYYNIKMTAQEMIKI